MNIQYEQHLLKRNIKPTSTRILVLKTILNGKGVFSLANLEDELGTVDKSTIFRTLNLFQQHHLLHTIDDGSGSLKYAICDETCDCALEQLHVHFYCTHCKRTYCFRDTLIPVIPLPKKFSVEGINYVMKGICEDCANFAT